MSMEEMIANLGKRVHHYRTKKELTLKELAERIGVTPSLLSQVEHGKAAPSLGTLKSIADEFGVPIGMLFEINGKASASPLIKKNTSKRIMTEGNILYSFLSPGREDMEVFLCDFPPGATTGETTYAHEGSECVYLLEGKLTLVLDEAEFQMEEGDSAVFESCRPHRVFNSSAVNAKAVWVESVPWLFKGE
jgi:transcriptional regulator with XRE-family HTH domain